MSYLGDNGERYIVYRDSQTEVLCHHDQDGLEAHPGNPDPDMSGSQLKGHPEQGKISENPEPSEQLSLDTPMPQPEVSPEQGTIVTNLGPPETYPVHPEWDKVIDPGPAEVHSGPPEQDQVTKHPTVSGTYSGPPE